MTGRRAVSKLLGTLLFGHAKAYTAANADCQTSRTARGGVMGCLLKCLPVLILGAAAAAYVDDPMLGIWKLNLAKSRYYLGSSPERSDAGL